MYSICDGVVRYTSPCGYVGGGGGSSSGGTTSNAYIPPNATLINPRIDNTLEIYDSRSNVAADSRVSGSTSDSNTTHLTIHANSDSNAAFLTAHASQPTQPPSLYVDAPANLMLTGGEYLGMQSSNLELLGNYITLRKPYDGLADTAADISVWGKPVSIRSETYVRIDTPTLRLNDAAVDPKALRNSGDENIAFGHSAGGAHVITTGWKAMGYRFFQGELTAVYSITPSIDLVQRPDGAAPVTGLTSLVQAYFTNEFDRVADSPRKSGYIRFVVMQQEPTGDVQLITESKIHMGMNPAQLGVFKNTAPAVHPIYVQCDVDCRVSFIVQSSWYGTI